MELWIACIAWSFSVLLGLFQNLMVHRVSGSRRNISLLLPLNYYITPLYIPLLHSLSIPIPRLLHSPPCSVSLLSCLFTYVYPAFTELSLISLRIRTSGFSWWLRKKAWTRSSKQARRALETNIITYLSKKIFEYSYSDQINLLRVFDF